MRGRGGDQGVRGGQGHEQGERTEGVKVRGVRGRDRDRGEGEDEIGKRKRMRRKGLKVRKERGKEGR